ncbi:MAG: NAD(P)-dependent oxidoreductase, partial [Rhizobiales bacterium]|nr:NAD(P)-dependent oxidoreductase [Hyphomicrobiales bacterium]
MEKKTRVGFIGVGLMGHGAAKHILETGGYPLTILGHRNREPVEDLVRRGASEAKDPAEVAAASDVVILCVPSSVEVEATFAGPRGLMGAVRPGMIFIDTTTADPAVTRKLGAELAERGAHLIDAAVGRTPKEAEAG